MFANFLLLPGFSCYFLLFEVVLLSVGHMLQWHIMIIYFFIFYFLHWFVNFFFLCRMKASKFYPFNAEF